MNGSEVGEPVPAGHPAGCLDYCSLSGCFDDRDFLVRQAVEGVDECIDPPIGRVNLTPNCRRRVPRRALKIREKVEHGSNKLNHLLVIFLILRCIQIEVYNRCTAQDISVNLETNATPLSIVLKP